MEAYHNGVEDYLIDSLSFKLPPGSSYVVDRKKSSFWAIGSNVYAPTTGTKVMKFHLSGEQGTWLDPGSVRLQFAVRNNETDAAKILRPLGGAHLFIRRLRVLVASTLVEDIMYYGRNHEMIEALYANEQARSNIDIENFGYRNIELIDNVAAGANNTRGIAGGSSQTVSFRLLSGLLGLSNKKYLPMKHAPITIEVEIVNSATEVLVEAGDSTANPAISAANTSFNWQLEDCQIKCDTVLLDSGLNENYTKHLLEGKALPLEFETFIAQENSILGNNISVQISRAVSKLNRMFLTFYKPTADGSETQKLLTNEKKQAVSFYHPMSLGSTVGNQNTPYNSNLELEFQIQLGGKLYPEYPCRTVNECFSILKETLNLPEKYQHSVGIKFDDYIRNKFIFGMDFEKVPDVDWSGINTKAGQILIVKVKGGSGITANIANSMFSTLVTQVVLEIRDVGCTLYD
jgi:hypothetical protein